MLVLESFGPVVAPFYMVEAVLGPHSLMQVRGFVCALPNFLWSVFDLQRTSASEDDLSAFCGSFL